MKKTLSIIVIFITAAVVAFFWVEIDTILTRKNHPLEYSKTIEACSERYAVPKELIYAVIKTESGFNEKAVSPKGACGLMQIMPDTYLWLCEKNSDANGNRELLFDPSVNIEYGTMYLSMLYSRFESWQATLAAYNAGPSTVEKWLGDENISTEGVLVNIPYEETEKYIKKVLKAKDNYKQLYFTDNKY